MYMSPPYGAPDGSRRRRDARHAPKPPLTHLTPGVSSTFGEPETPHVVMEPGYAPYQEEFEFCRHFVITVALRLTEINARAVPLSWR